MYSPFDWLRRSRTGSELLSTLQYLAVCPDLPEDEIGGPHSALGGPCLRCWLYPRPRKGPGHGRYCETCEIILGEAGKLHAASRGSVVVWGFVNQLPDQLRIGGRFHDSVIFDPYVHDDQRFLLMLYQRELRPWLQELVVYNGSELKGFIQILPTSGLRDMGMGDLLCRVIQNEAQFPMDLLRIRFFAEVQQIFLPDFQEREGLLTFEVTEFLAAMEMAAVFRSLLRPEEQEQVYQVLKMGHNNEERFFWGRLLTGLSAEARDMLQAWRMRQWSGPQIDMLYDLMRYVGFYQPR
ncbi:MAG: hypothetical protein WCP34_10340 [Pseudomonadota bacterium]